MRQAAKEAGDVERMQTWSGQSAMLAAAKPAADVLRAVADGLAMLASE